MPALTVHVDDDALARLQRCANDMGRTVDDLAEAAISEAAMQAAPHVTASNPFAAPRGA